MKKFYTPFTNSKKIAVSFLAVLFCLIIKSENTFSQIVTTYSTPGNFTFTVPAGVTSIKVEAWGAGAGGARGVGGGGGGAYAGNFNLSVVSGNYSVTVGAGSGVGLGASGGTSSFAALVVAEGGGKGANILNGGRVANSTGAVGLVWAGGNGGTSNGNGGAGGGGSAGAGGVGGNGNTTANGTGAAGGLAGIAGTGTAGAAGGAGGNNGTSSPGVSGSAPGGGGGERSNSNANPGSGGGGNGQVIVTYFAPSITTGTISPLSYCGGNASAAVSVPFTSVGTYAASNTYTAQLSTSAGTFPGTNIGTLVNSNVNSGTISATIPAGTAAGTLYRIRVTSSNPAVTGADNGSNITINNPAAPTGSASQPFCAINSPTVNSLSPTGANIKWYAAASGGSALAGATPLVNGTHYFASQTVSGCEGSARLDVTATVGNPAAPTGSASQQFCAINNPTLASISVVGTLIQWYAASSGGSALANTTPLVNGSTYYASQTISGCESATRLAVNVTVGNPAAPTGSASQPFCSINNPTLASINVVGTAIQWYAASTGGSALANTTPLVNGTTYYASQTVSGCESATRLAVAVTVGNPAAPTGAASQPFCSINNPTLASINVTGTAIQWYATSIGGSALANTTPIVNGTTYYASQTVSGCESATRLAVAVTVGNPVAPTGAASQLFCANTNPTVTNLTATGTAIQWYSAATGGTTLAGGIALVDGNHYYASQTVSGCESATRLDVTATVYQPPVITGNPSPASSTLCTNGTINYTVSATGSNLTYLWYLNGSLISNGGDFSGATTATLHITGADPTDAGNYTVTVSGSSPCTSVTSTPVSLTVNQTIGFTAQPAASTTLCPGQTFTISATVAGTVNTYQWYKGSSPYTTVPGTVSGSTYTLSIPGITAADAGSYKLFVDDGISACPSAFSSIAVLNVNTNTTTTDPIATQTVCQNNTPTNLTTTASGTGPFTYQWYSNTINDNTTGTPVGGATSSTYTPLTTVAGTTYYYVIVTGNCNSATSATSQVIVTVIPTAAITYAGTPFCKSAGVQSVTLAGTGAYTGGTYASAAGLTINSGTGAITPSSSTAGTYTVTYTVPASGGCAAVPVTTSVTITAVPTATITYAGTPFCKSVGTAQSVTLTGTGAYTGGGYASTVGLTIDAVTGAITPSTSTAGTYTVTYTIPASSGCAAVPVTTSVTITAVPTAAITYAGTPFCKSVGVQSVTLTGTGAYTGGTYASTAGLTINAGTGAITPSSSTAGTYTVTYTVPASGGCAAVPVTTSVTITAVPTATISYSGNPFCKSVGTAQPVTLTGTGAYTGGGYASTVGLSIDAVTGAITPSTSTAGTYTVTYTIPASGGCAAVPVTTSVTITAVPTAAITYAGTPFCKSVSTAQAVTLTGTGAYTGGTYASTAGLTINSGTGAITPSSSTAGTYTVTYTVPASGGCAAVPVTTSVTITAVPTATITYAGTPFCKSVGTAQSVTLTGTGAYTGGGYASTVGLTIDAVTGAITPSTSTAGTYTVTYTIPASSGCAAVPVTTSVTITAVPTAAITYAGTPFCKSVGVQSVTLTGTGAYTGGTYASTAGLTINAGTGAITPSSSTAGTYTVTYTVPASGGCAAVPVTTSVTITAVPTATISYSGNPFCKSVGTAQSVTLTGTGAYTGGGYASTVGLTIDAVTGAITPSTSTAGTYTVTYTIPASGGCAAVPVTTSVTINTPPSITGQPANQVVCAGNSKSFTVTAAGTSPTYQWQYSANGSSGWVNVGNGTPANTNYGGTGNNATLTVNVGGGAAAGTDYYQCIVSVNGCSSVTSNVATLTVNVNSIITLTSAVGTDGQTVCQNTAITPITYVISGGGTGASITSGALPAGVTGTYNPGTKIFTVSGTPTTAIGSPFNYTITTTGPCTQATASGTITVLVIPTGTVTVAENSGTMPNDNIICAGDAVTFTAPNGGMNATYIFKVNGTVVQGPNTSRTYNTTTLASGQSVTVDVANGNNCGSTFTAPTVTVNPLPAPTLTVTESSGTPNDKIICPNAPVTLTATPSNPTSTYGFIINGTVVTSGTSNTYTTMAIVTNSTVAIMETNSNGCQFTTPIQNITVTNVPAGTLSVSPGNTFCAGTNAIFTATATPPTTGYTYNFKVNGISQQNNGTNTYTTNALTSGQVVTVDVTNSNGCTITFNPIAVTVNPLPTGTLNAFENSGTQNDNSICANAPVTYTFSNTTYSGYNFKLNGISKQNNGTASYINSTLVAGDVVTVVVTSGGGCPATFTAPAITIVAAPTVTLSASPTTVCAGNNVTFTATPSDPTYNYNFQVNGTTVQNGSANTYNTTSIASTDVVTVDVTNSNSCTTTSNAVSVTVTPLPTVVTHDQAVCSPNTVDLTAAAITSGSTSGLTFTYFTDPGATIVYSTPTTAGAGTYYIKGTTAGGCSSVTPVTITVNPLPVVAAITGSNNVCVGNTITLSDATSGGTWASLNTAIATIDATTGVVTGVTSGSATITYTVTNIATTCSNTVSYSITVNPLPVVNPITGNLNVCTTTTSQLNDATTGGTWSSSNTAVATIDMTTGLVTGISPGTSTISYTVTNANLCTTVVTANLTVSTLPSVAAITTTASYGFNACIGNTVPLQDATSGGVWSSSNTGVATVSSTGIVTGVTAGTSDISYTITTTCGQIVSAVQTVTINTPPSATISYSGNPFCTSSGPVSVTQTGTTGGAYSASPSGLSLAADGTITPASSTPGTYTVTYTIAASGGCSLYTTTNSVTITATPTITSLSYSGTPYCSTVTSASPSLVASSTTGTYTSTGGLTINSSTGVINPSTSTAGTYTVTYTIAASGGCALINKTTTVTITANPTITSLSYSGTPYCSTVTTTSPTLVASSTGGTYSSTAGLTINSSTGVINPSTSTAGTYIITYAIAASGGCGIVSATTSVTITAAPTAVAGTAVQTCSNNPPVNITAGSSATNYSTIVWTSSGTGTFASQGSLTAATYTPSATDISAGSVTLTLKANGNGGCGTPATSTKNLTIYPPPPAFVITPSGTVNACQGNILPLTATANASSTGSITIPSGNINLAIPDATFFGLIPGTVTNNLAVSTVPAGAIINSMNVTFNINHTYDGDLVLNLKAPNGKVLNLVDQRGRSGQNFTNTIVSSTSTNPFLNGAGNAPFTGTFVADGDNGVGTPNSGNNVFSNLFSTPNGTWTFGAEDDGVGDVGTILNWSITFNYTTPTSALPVTWSPVTDLYTDAGATTAYTGTALSTVYSKPSSPVTQVYTATATNANGCSTSQNVTLNVSATPVVTVTADYCAISGKVVLKATSVPAATSYAWSTGSIKDTTQVDVSGIYNVTVYSAGSTCPGKGTINVANELIKNGNFEAGNVLFTSSYPYRTGAGSLNNPPGYAVDTAANYYGPSFLWGKDHTTTHGKFMMVNGAAGANYNVWQQTINVLPNTTYYFSAWGLELDNLPNNPNPPFGPPANATLQFTVNGGLVGNFANLPRPNNPTRDQDNNGWVRFYGNWTSGPTTTSAIVTIADLQGAVYGNNFGLDDISFSTLSTFVNLVSNPGTDAQTVCVNTPIQNIVYSAGSSASQPTTIGLPAGVTPSWNGVLLTISGTPTVAGNYSYTITTTGSCQPASASGTITVQGQKIALSSGTASPSVCANAPITSIAFTLSGTATGATASGLPTGLTGIVSGSGPTYTYTISGTPTAAAGSYPYTITTSGPTCSAMTFNGTITITSQTITLNSGNNTQTVCINSPINNIQYTIGGTATGASVSGLPPGVTGRYNTGLFIINGTPTSATLSPYNYTVTTSGTCGAVTATGTITVTPAATLTLTSAAGTDAQTICKPNAIIAITYSVNGGTGASATGLPAGVSGAFNAGVFTISGTPTAAPGIYSYTITTSGGCGAGTTMGTITIQAPTITLTSGVASPTVCINTAMANIVYTVGGTATGANVTGLPTGVGFTVVGNVVTIGGSPSVSGPFAYTITTTGGGCTQASLTGTITVNAASIGGTVASVSICSGASGSLTLSGSSSPTPIRWEYSTDFGNTWTTIANTTITQTFNNITIPTQYRAVVDNGCGPVFSSVATVGIHNYWTGTTSTDWNTASNWSDNLVPSTSCPDVYIPNTPNKPVLSNTPVATITNLHILSGAILTVNGTGTLQIGGTISNSGTFDASNGAIDFNGTTAQTIAPSTFMNNAVKGLVITNTAGVTLGGALDVYGSLTYGVNNGKLITNGNLTLKSTITQTAWVGDMTNHIINGDVTVERYIATGPTGGANHGKSWQLLATSTKGQTINQSWMEGASATNVSSPLPGSPGNPVMNYGTMMTSDRPTAVTSDGFDAYTTPGPSIKVYNAGTGLYDGPVNTSVPVYNQKGYFVFVRGDRSVYTSAAAAVPTILRTKGTLFTTDPAHLPPSTSIGVTSFESIGNPYAAPLDMRKITKTPGVEEFIQVWDPRIGGAYNYGAFVTFLFDGTDYRVGVNGGGSYPASGNIYNYIQSGQAFFMQTSPGMSGTVSFSEAAKAGNSFSGTLFTREASGGNGRIVSDPTQSLLRMTLNSINTDGSAHEALDGVLDQFGDNFSNDIDSHDARKVFNTGENLSIKTAGKLLVIERRHTIIDNDTIFLNLTGERAQPYQFSFDAQNLNTVATGFVEDAYTKTRTPLNISGNTVVSFKVENIPGSYAPDRFRIVFSPLKVLPVTFTSIKAYKKAKDIDVEWRVDNERNIKQYEIEKSINGTDFSTLTVTKPSGNNGSSAVYVIDDTKPVDGYNYYRVRSVDISGVVSYSTIVKVAIGVIKGNIEIHPNPITDGQIHLQFMNEPAGKYGIRLLNKLGQVISQKQITREDGSSIELIKWDFNLAHGIYNLEVTKPDGSIKDINVLY